MAMVDLRRAHDDPVPDASSAEGWPWPAAVAAGADAGVQRPQSPLQSGTGHRTEGWIAIRSRTHGAGCCHDPAQPAFAAHHHRLRLPYLPARIPRC